MMLYYKIFRLLNGLVGLVYREVFLDGVPHFKFIRVSVCESGNTIVDLSLQYIKRSENLVKTF